MTQASPAQPENHGSEAASAVPATLGSDLQQAAAAAAAAQQQMAAVTAGGQVPMPLALPQNGNKLPVQLPPQGPAGLPDGVVGGPLAGAPSGPSLLGHSPETGLIAVSSSASIASSAAAAGPPGGPGSAAGGPGSAAGGPGSITGGGTPEGNKTLYLGNLHPFVTEATLQEVFAGVGGITELKVIKDKATGVSAGYGFAKFADTPSAQAALDKVAKTVLFGQEARINWAFQKEQREEVANHFHVFVGDLSSDVTDAMLHAAFQGCPGCSDARVMWDHATGRSRGYGFVSFRLAEEAEAAIQMMHGQFIGARRVRCGWAQHKTEGIVSMDPQILDRADPTNTNVYVGNLSPSLSDAEVRRHFGAFGPIAEVKLYRKGSYGFVRYKAHGDAVRAIVGMNGQSLGGKVMKCSWGRHPNTPPSGVQASLMLAAAAGLNPLAMGSAGMLGHGGMGPPPLGMMAGGGMMGAPMGASAPQTLLHAGQGGMGGAGVVGQPSAASAVMGGGGPSGVLPVDHNQLSQMAGMSPYGMPYGGSGMAFFGGGVS